ncbi:Pentatricopeptide repeat-containing protein [Drosera capensis]
MDRTLVAGFKVQSANHFHLSFVEVISLEPAYEYAMLRRVYYIGGGGGGGGGATRSCRPFCSKQQPPTTQEASSSELLGMYLLTASFAKTLSHPGTRNLSAYDFVPLSESLVLQVLARNSLDISHKMDFFNWCSSSQKSESPAAFKHSAATYSQMFRIILSHSSNRRRGGGGLPWEDVARDLLGSMNRDGITLDSTTLQLLLDAFIKSGNPLAATEILDLMQEPGASSLYSSRIYNSVVMDLVRKKQLASAVSMFMKLLGHSTGSGGGITPEPLACNVLLVALRRAGMKEEFKAVFLTLREKMVVFDKRGFNICIHAFGCWGDLETSLKLFKEMKDVRSESDSHGGPDLCTYNSLIRVLFLLGRAKDALAIFEELKGSGHEPDAFTYRIVIHGCARSYRIEDATKVFDEMQLKGFHPGTPVYNSLLDALFKVKELTEACQLFEKMIKDGIKASCCTEGEFEASLRLVEDMESRGLVVDLVTITAMVMELYKQGLWDSIDRLLKHVGEANLLPDVLKWKANVEALLKNSSSRRKDFTSIFPHKGGLKNLLSSMDADSSTISDGLENPNVGTQFSMRDDWSSFPYMDQLAEQGVSDNHRFPRFSLLKGRRVQGDMMSTFNIDMVNTYLSIFLAKGNLSLACKLFEIFTDEGVGAVSYTYNSIASSFVKKGYFDEVWGVLHAMCDKLCPADVATYNIIVQNLGKMGRADLASSVLNRLMESGGYLDVVMYNTLINGLGKAGRFDDAEELFNQMKSSGVNPDIVTFNTLVEVHAKAGRLKDAKKFLGMMIDAGLPPNHVTHTIIDFGKEKEKLGCRKASVLLRLKGCLILDYASSCLAISMTVGCARLLKVVSSSLMRGLQHI